MIIISLLIVLPFKAARSWNGWAKAGSIHLSTLFIILGVGIVSTAALIAWAQWTDNFGVAVTMAAGIQYYPKVVVSVLFIPGFALLNSVAEEVVYRGVLQTALTDFFKNSYLVISLQAAAFAALHFAAGFLNGITGYIMTFMYGSVLGYLRMLSNGLLAPILSHIIADLAIFYYMANLVWENSA